MREMLERTWEEEMEAWTELLDGRPCFPEFGKHEGCWEMCYLAGLCKQVATETPKEVLAMDKKIRKVR